MASDGTQCTRSLSTSLGKASRASWNLASSGMISSPCFMISSSSSVVFPLFSPVKRLTNFTEGTCLPVQACMHVALSSGNGLSALSRKLRLNAAGAVCHRQHPIPGKASTGKSTHSSAEMLAFRHGCTPEQCPASRRGSISLSCLATKGLPNFAPNARDCLFLFLSLRPALGTLFPVGRGKVPRQQFPRSALTVGVVSVGVQSLKPGRGGGRRGLHGE